MEKSRSQIFKDLGVRPTNSRWAWCAHDDQLKLSVFTLWEDEKLEGQKWILHNNFSPYRKNGYFDQGRILLKTIKKGYEALGIICIAIDVNSSPRKIKEVRVDKILRLKLINEGDKIIAQKIGELSFIEIIRKNNKISKNDAVLDLDSIPVGFEVSDRALIVGYTYKRDFMVRSYVIKQANGICEYCKTRTFQVKNGTYFLEAHHIIALADQGQDTVDNVIALCPNHHREAHFGENAELLEIEFQKIIKVRIGCILQ